MQKKYIVRLSDEERDTLREVVNKLKGASRKVRRAQILLNSPPRKSQLPAAAVAAGASPAVGHRKRHFAHAANDTQDPVRLLRRTVSAAEPQTRAKSMALLGLRTMWI